MYITQNRLKECLNYDATTGIFTWKEKRKGLRVGDIAGSLMVIGYITICIDKKAYGAHRLAWLYMHNETPEVVDHIDGDKTNNRIKNLRAATKSTNALNNSGVRINSTTGIHGVSVERRTGTFVAKLVINKSVVLCKRFNTAKEAEFAYKEAKKLHCPEITSTHKNFQC